MAHCADKIQITAALSKQLFPLALCICVVITLIAPGAYGYLEFRRIRKEAGVYASQLSDSIRHLASTAPALWKYQATKYSQILQAFVPFKGIQSITILDDQSNPISQLSHGSDRSAFLGIEGKPAAIIFNNNRIGEIRIRLTARAFIFEALGVFAVCLVVGIGLSSLVYRLPLGVVKRLERELRDHQLALLEAKAGLEQRVRARTRQLQAQIRAKEQALTELATAQDSLLEASRLAGRAEVATGVLHNVGNVLNSINVSCTLLTDQLRESRVGNLTKVAQLIAEQQSDPGLFFTQDPRGVQIPAYLASLASALEEEHQVLFRESESLHGRIEHIKEIVAMQQHYGRVSGVNETILPERLIEDALILNAGALTRHGIDVRRVYEPVPAITVDKHSVLQVLLNLINNAKCACTEGGGGEKQITLKILQRGTDRVGIQVADNGIGIPAENMTRIFQHGFTTRQNGHGFGLHSGALTARRLGGSLSVYSEGPGLGATFTLELPCRMEESV